MQLVLLHPDIPQNTGTLLRLAACWGIPVAVVEPCGFVWHDAKLRRAGMDYMELAAVARYVSFGDYQKRQHPGRLIAIETTGAQPYTAFAFHPDDRIMVGAASTGCQRKPCRPPMRCCGSPCGKGQGR